MNHEIAGPEYIRIRKAEARTIAMPGQLRVGEDVEISKHIAQFWSVGMSKVEEDRIREKQIQDWRTAINRARSSKRLEALKTGVREWYLKNYTKGEAAVLLTDLADTRLARMSLRAGRNTRVR